MSPTYASARLRPLTSVVDTALDLSLLGYTSIGPLLRRRTWPADPEPGSMAGRRVLVTGATSGIGEAMAGAFADLGATVHLLGRNEAKTARVARELRLRHPVAEVVEEVCDVSDLDAVRAFAADLGSRVESLHGLVHNAGTITTERTTTRQGHETALAAHVLGPHLLTELLLPLLQAAGGGEDGPASVVWMSSGGMYTSGLVDDLEFERGSYDGVRAYARTKRMQVVLADAWARRLAGEPAHGVVRSESMHPGWVETPGIAEHLPGFRALTRRVLRDPAQGADTAVWLVATRPPSRPGHFWHDRAQRPTTYGWERGQDPADVADFLAEVTTITETAPFAALTSAG